MKTCTAAAPPAGSPVKESRKWFGQWFWIRTKFFRAQSYSTVNTDGADSAQACLPGLAAAEYGRWWNCHCRQMKKKSWQRLLIFWKARQEQFVTCSRRQPSDSGRLLRVDYHNQRDWVRARGPETCAI